MLLFRCSVNHPRSTMRAGAGTSCNLSSALPIAPGPFTSPPTFRLCAGQPRVTETLFPVQGEGRSNLSSRGTRTRCGHECNP
jgi:hypothetical protein